MTDQNLSLSAEEYFELYEGLLFKELNTDISEDPNTLYSADCLITALFSELERDAMKVEGMNDDTLRKLLYEKNEKYLTIRNLFIQKYGRANFSEDYFMNRGRQLMYWLFGQGAGDES